MSAPTPAPPPLPPVAFDEFKLVYESTERVTDRRLELSKTNSSLATLVIAGMGLTVAWAYDKPDIDVIALAGVALVAFLGCLFCLWWIRQIESYKDLNAAKFTVLNEMAKRVVFCGYSHAGIASARPFEREWEILSAKAELQTYKAGHALRSTSSEFIVPSSFMVLFGIVTLSAAAYDMVSFLNRCSCG